MGHRASMKSITRTLASSRRSVSTAVQLKRASSSCHAGWHAGDADRRGHHAGPHRVRPRAGPSCGLNRCQYYEGAAFHVAKACVAELHELEPAQRHVHLMEMSVVAAAVFGAFAHNEDAFAHDELVRQPRAYSVGVSMPRAECGRSSSHPGCVMDG